MKYCKFGCKFDLILFFPCLNLGLCLLEGNLDFISVFGIYNIQISLIDNLKEML